uniref:Uncharacterized protein n=1 Tax=Oryza nivara TaxID=4536 RepID=A0A0E0J293_ORYNI
MATSGTAAAPRRGGKRPPPTGGGRDSAGRGRGMGSCDAGGEKGQGAASPVGIKGSGAAMGEVAAPPWGEGREQGLGISGLHSHRGHEAPARPKSPNYRQTGPTTRTNKSPQPPKDSTAGSRNRWPRQGRSIKEWRGPGRPKGKLRAEGKGHKNIGVFHVFGEGLRASQGKPYNLQLWQPPPTSPPAQREEHCGKQQSK